LSLAGSAEERIAVAFALRVGFGRRFGVKLSGLWAVEGGLPKPNYGSKRFN
jgi:hypothetical protein